MRLLTDNNGDFAMRFEPHHTVNDMGSRRFELLRPVQVAGFVESRCDFDHASHLFSGLCSSDQGTDKRSVVSNPVDRHFDRQHGRVVCGLLDKLLDRCIKTLVRMVDQHVASPDQGQHISVSFQQSRRNQRCPRLIA